MQQQFYSRSSGLTFQLCRPSSNRILWIFIWIFPKNFLKLTIDHLFFFFFFHIIVPREIWFGWFSDFSTFFRTKFLIITRYLVKYNVRYRINRRMNALKKVVSVMQAFSAGYPFKKIFLIKFKPSFHPRVHFFFCVSAQASARS